MDARLRHVLVVRDLVQTALMPPRRHDDSAGDQEFHHSPAPQDRRREQPREGAPGHGKPADGGHSPLVRPYAMTRGRTRARYELAIETLVHTTAEPRRLTGQLPEHRRICQLCREVKSVAEISALLPVPLAVARVLVADLADAGLVAVHQPHSAQSGDSQPDITLLERVLSGLRAL